MAALGDLLIVPVSSYPGWLRSPTTPVIALCAPAAAMPAGNPKIAIEAWGIDPLLA